MNILDTTRTWGEQHYPNASQYKHAAFANSTWYALEHVSGGFGGPSIREHVAAKMIDDSRKTFTLEQACLFVAPIVYGPLTDMHRQMWRDFGEICFDNDPEDEQLLR